VFYLLLYSIALRTFSLSHLKLYHIVWAMNIVQMFMANWILEYKCKNTIYRVYILIGREMKTEHYKVALWFPMNFFF